jgi:hypothetical protein
MTREEFELRRLKEDRALYPRLVPIYVMILLAFVAMSIAAFFMGKAPISLGGALIILSLALRVPAILQHKTDTVDAVAEYEAYLANPERDESMLSESTLYALRTTPHSAKELKQQWLAYGILSVVLIGSFVFLLNVVGTSRHCLPSAPRFWSWASSWRG